jgi:hypothetical protein
MSTITLSRTTYQRLHRYARGYMSGTAKRLPDGRMSVPVDDDVVVRMDQLRKDHESDDQIILRMMNDWDRRNQ